MVLELMDKQSGRSINLPKEVAVRRENNSIVLENRLRQYTDARLSAELTINGDTNLVDNILIRTRIIEYDSSMPIPDKLYTKWLDYDKINAGLVVRCRMTGDYITFGNDDKKKKLKSYFIDEKVPLGERDKVILIAEQDHILWAIGYRISSYYKVSDKTKRVLEITYSDKSCRN